MPLQNFGIYNQILVDDTRPRFHQKVTELLVQIDSMALGSQMLTEIENSGKRVVIVEAVAGGGNKCTSGGPQRFYTLRAALLDDPTNPLARVLGRALMRAAAGGWTLQRLGEAMADGMTPATVRTVNNLAPRTTMTPGARNLVGGQIAKIIEDVADGRIGAVALNQGPPGEYRISDRLVRILRPYDDPGAGAASRISFNLDQHYSCMGDKMKRRPLEIGLAHELCHAWRNAVGQRTFDDAMICGFDDDEVMTTGFPPYTSEKFSENLFRQQWNLQRPWYKAKIDLRVNYR